MFPRSVLQIMACIWSSFHYILLGFLTHHAHQWILSLKIFERTDFMWLISLPTLIIIFTSGHSLMILFDPCGTLWPFEATPPILLPPIINQPRNNLYHLSRLIIRHNSPFTFFLQYFLNNLWLGDSMQFPFSRWKCLIPKNLILMFSSLRWYFVVNLFLVLDNKL